MAAPWVSYKPIDLASQLTFMDMIQWPRPVGIVLYVGVGNFGLHGSIAAIMAVVVVDCAIAAALFRRIAGWGCWAALAGLAAHRI